MQTQDFHFELPDELIARYPLKQRSGSRLLVLNAADSQISHGQFADLPDLLNEHDLLIFNNTRVINARLHGNKSTGGRVELLLERLLSDREGLFQIKASKSPKSGGVILLEDGTELTVESRDTNFFTLSAVQPLLDILDRLGHVPLPPYMQRQDEQLDKERYQTVYGVVPGAVAAPTAGLHFDNELLAILRAKGIQHAFVTLHVGAGTFQPVRVENIADHQMHSEWLSVDQQLVDAVKQCRQRGGRVIAVGTTSVRSLETAALGGDLKTFSGDSDIFIYPGYEFRVVDAMITNFHLPGSTLIMLVSAFAGRDLTLKAYTGAIKEQYRFFSYGDAMFIHR